MIQDRSERHVNIRDQISLPDGLLIEIENIRINNEDNPSGRDL